MTENDASTSHPKYLSKVEISTGSTTASFLLIKADGSEIYSREMSRDQIDKEIMYLGQVRAALSANLPPERLEGHDVQAVASEWYTMADVERHLSIICFVHPFFGRLGFMLDPSAASQMTVYLVQQLHLHLQHSRDASKTEDPVA